MAVNWDFNEGDRPGQVRRVAARMTEAEARGHWARWEGFRAATGRKPADAPSPWTQPTFCAAGVRLGLLDPDRLL